MFYRLMLQKTVWVPCEHFGTQLRDKIKEILCNSVEGRVEIEHCSFVIAVLDVKTVSSGKLQDTGDAVFHVEYEALVQRHFKGEVVDATAFRITPPQSVAFRVGALEVFVRVKGMTYDSDAKGFVTASGVSILKEGTVTKIRLIQCTVPGHSIELIGELPN